jgi:hypothetical protein
MIKNVISNIPIEEWEDISRKCDHSTFFHTPRWSRVFTATYKNMESFTFKFIFDDGKTALLPVIKEKSRVPLVYRYFSGIFGVYGGPISEDTLTLEQHMEILKWADKNLKSYQLRINPFDDSIKNLKWSNYKSDFTSLHDLRKGLNEIYHSWSRGNRDAVKQSTRYGIEIKEATTIEQWHDYYDIYIDSIARWGENATNNYPRQLFENMQADNDKNIKLWLAYLDNKPVSGIICVYHNQHCAGWHMATLKEFLTKRPTQLLIYNTIKHASYSGYRYYDLSPSGGHESVVESKRRYGMQTLEAGMINKNVLYIRSVEELARISGKLSATAGYSRIKLPLWRKTVAALPGDGKKELKQDIDI